MANKGKVPAPQSSPLSKNFLIKMFNKGKEFYEPYGAIVPEVKSKYDFNSPQGQSGHFSSPSVTSTNLLTHIFKSQIYMCTI